MLKLQYSTKVPSKERERNTKKNNIMKKIIILVLVALSILFVTSCNVTRTITNESQYFQKGDTSVVITTKTIETYDASKKN